ncbi:hypothetical protein A3709_19310 [Halioglobus sp. HI00S01]|uniref:hypothetical protein n=1 Tax=Halioglobus sp. HI00S01 TaxID=1822214 RepID=UPI0007C2EC59|nr:hypothetical protein [Halioglobus sp. HI00S01]KZX57773.1 hypothetical protein A3709_19310 [Halioglobus sp. HI00S01]
MSTQAPENPTFTASATRYVVVDSEAAGNIFSGILASLPSVLAQHHNAEVEREVFLSLIVDGGRAYTRSDTMMVAENIGEWVPNVMPFWHLMGYMGDVTHFDMHQLMELFLGDISKVGPFEAERPNGASEVQILVEIA